MNKHFVAVLVATAMMSAQPVFAADTPADVIDMKTLRAAVQSDKRAFVASTLELTAAEAKRFWPVYDGYQLDLDLANRRRTVALEGMIGVDSPRSDVFARNLANELIAADEAEIKSRRTLQNRLMRPVPTRIMPPKKAARYLQLEAKIRAVQAYDVASAIPLIR